ncbi:MAG: mechanosensitive ion channel family protein [Candidatus Electrothrix sp. AR5]|nr:mechanosensitive ion channel family protein [Candidatus Electrothrix sp. AR5]
MGRSTTEIVPLIPHCTGGKIMNDKVRKGLYFAVPVILLLTVFIILRFIDDKETFEILLTFFGIIISAAVAISSTTFISNFMAGVMLSMISTFRPGNFLSVGEHFGKVTERGLLHTEIQTENSGDLTTLPNLYLLTNPCKVVREERTVVSATVSLGYDVPHAQIRALLTKAAEEVPLKEPFVQICNLGDFSVEYRIAGILENVKQLLTTRSKLRVNILNALHNAKIEIVSSTFMYTRALSPKKQVLPDMQEPDIHDDTVMESVVFDKANEAESMGKMRSRYDLISEQIKAIESRIKETDAEDELQHLQREVAWRTTSMERLRKKIEHAKD